MRCSDTNYKKYILNKFCISYAVFSWRTLNGVNRKSAYSEPQCIGFR